MFYRNANAALLVFDITSKSSFENMKGWVQELKGHVLEPMVLVVVGNKIDLINKREVREFYQTINVKLSTLIVQSLSVFFIYISTIIHNQMLPTH